MKNKNLRIGAVVLAAGYASRMGTCKALLYIKGRSAVSRVIGTLREAGVDDPVVVAGCYREKVEHEARACGARTVFNERYDDGMFSSVRAGVESLSGDLDAFFLLPADIPMVRPSTCRALKEAFLEGVEVVYPAFRGVRGHPPLIGARLIPEILAWKGDGGLRALLAHHEEGARVIEVPDGGISLDMDTPEDHALLNLMAEREDIPSEQECLAFHDLFDSPQKVREHCFVVAKVAGVLAERLRGVHPVDPPLLMAAAQLHDMARTLPNHAEEAARALEAWGFPEPADLVRHHMDLPENEPQLSGRSLLYLADKITSGNRVVELDQKSISMGKRLSNDPHALEAALWRLRKAMDTASAFEKTTGTRLEEALSSLL